MKVLWITNTALGALSEKLTGKRTDGLWMGALLNDFIKKKEHQLVIATTTYTKKTIEIEEDGIKYYALPSTPPILYDENKKANISAWKELLDYEKPDLIQVWGTEFTHGLCALRLAKNIPSVIYMQGVLYSIARSYLAGMTNKELVSSITFRDFIKQDSIKQQQKKYFKRSIKEKEMLALSGRIISENDWCDTIINSLVKDVKSYHCPLSVNECFSISNWDVVNIERHSIMTNASGYPLKGLHMTLRAVKLLKDRYPDVKLYVPGAKVVSDGSSFIWKLRKRGYAKHIEKLIKKLDLKDNVVWLGNMAQKDMAKILEKINVFVLASSMENHSSSLKEAMIVGVPSVSSYVGGIPEYIRHNESGCLFRFEEYEMMAYYISKIFDSDDFACKIGQNGKEDMLKLHSGTDIYKKIIEIYVDILRD